MGPFVRIRSITVVAAMLIGVSLTSLRTNSSHLRLPTSVRLSQIQKRRTIPELTRAKRRRLLGAHSQFLTELRESLNNPNRSQLTPILITTEGTLLCPHLTENTANNRRTKAFSQMIQTGLQTHHLRLSKYEQSLNKALPLLLMRGDVSGCGASRPEANKWKFPRLTWYIPSDVHGSEWCSSITVPSFRVWENFGKPDGYYNDRKKKNEHIYPWDSKIPKAVWRGSSTHDASQFNRTPFHEIPRAKLVQASKDHPNIIDAAFTLISGRFANTSKEIEPTTIMADRMSFDDQMKYKGKS